MSKIVTIISNYNEERSIRETIEDFRQHCNIKSDLLVIDNCSTDRSLEIIQELGVDYVVHPVNSGGSAGVIKSALQYAYRNNYDYYCHMDGDNQHNAGELFRLMEAFYEDPAVDIVVGSRFIENKGYRSMFIRRIGIILFSRLLSLITKKKFTDITSGFRAYNRRAIEFFGTKFKQEIDSITQLELASFYGGLKRKDVPVTMKPRIEGKSEINFKNAVKFPAYNLIGIIGTLLNRKS